MATHRRASILLPLLTMSGTACICMGINSATLYAPDVVEQSCMTAVIWLEGKDFTQLPTSHPRDR